MAAFLACYQLETAAASDTTWIQSPPLSIEEKDDSRARQVAPSTTRHALGLESESTPVRVSCGLAQCLSGYRAPPWAGLNTHAATPPNGGKFKWIHFSHIQHPDSVLSASALETFSEELLERLAFMILMIHDSEILLRVHLGPGTLVLQEGAIP